MLSSRDPFSLLDQAMLFLDWAEVSFKKKRRLAAERLVQLGPTALAQLTNKVQEEEKRGLAITHERTTTTEKLLDFAKSYPDLVAPLMDHYNNPFIAAQQHQERQLKPQEFIRFLYDFSKLPYSHDNYQRLAGKVNAHFLTRLFAYKDCRNFQLPDNKKIITVNFNLVFTQLVDKYPSLILHGCDDLIERSGPGIEYNFITKCLHKNLHQKLHENEILSIDKKKLNSPGSSIQDQIHSQHTIKSCFRGTRYPHRIAEIDRYLTHDKEQIKDKKQITIEDEKKYTLQKETACQIVKTAAEALNHPRTYRSLWYITRSANTTLFYEGMIDKLCYIDYPALQALVSKIDQTDFTFKFGLFGGVSMPAGSRQARLPHRVKKIRDLLIELTTAPSTQYQNRPQLIREIILHAVDGLNHGGGGQTASTREFYQLVIDTFIQKKIPTKGAQVETIKKIDDEREVPPTEKEREAFNKGQKRIIP